MGWSIQVVGNRHEGIEDVSLLVLLHLMLRQAEASGKHEHSKLTEAWENIFKIYGPGVIDLELDAIVSDPSRKSYFLSLLDAVDKELDGMGETYPVAELKKGWRTRAVRLNNDYKTASIRSAIAALRKLVK